MLYVATKPKKADVIVLERSHDSAFRVFVKTMREKKGIDQEEYKLLERFWRLFPKPDTFIGLWSDDYNTIYMRVVGRDGLGNVDNTWVKRVYDQYNDYFDTLKAVEGPLYVQLDCIKPQVEVAEDALKIVKEVLNSRPPKRCM